jgi:hypothetical protein
MIQLSIALLFAFLGYLIKYKQWSWLIAGYNTSSKKEKEKYDVTALCNGVGGLMFVFCGIFIVGSFGEFFNQAWLISATGIIFAIVIIIFLIYANTGGRYKKNY